jgi:deoxyribodipyrimidine photolyase
MAPEDQLGIVLGHDYPERLVKHNEARQKALLHYKRIKTHESK